jgi:hypothetical protein
MRAAMSCSQTRVTLYYVVSPRGGAIRLLEKPLKMPVRAVWFTRDRHARTAPSASRSSSLRRPTLLSRLELQERIARQRAVLIQLTRAHVPFWKARRVYVVAAELRVVDRGASCGLAGDTTHVRLPGVLNDVEDVRDDPVTSCRYGLCSSIAPGEFQRCRQVTVVVWLRINCEESYGGTGSHRHGAGVSALHGSAGAAFECHFGDVICVFKTSGALQAVI